MATECSSRFDNFRRQRIGELEYIEYLIYCQEKLSPRNLCPTFVRLAGPRLAGFSSAFSELLVVCKCFSLSLLFYKLFYHIHLLP